MYSSKGCQGGLKSIAGIACAGRISIERACRNIYYRPGLDLGAGVSRLQERHQQGGGSYRDGSQKATSSIAEVCDELGRQSQSISLRQRRALLMNLLDQDSSQVSVD